MDLVALSGFLNVRSRGALRCADKRCATLCGPAALDRALNRARKRRALARWRAAARRRRCSWHPARRERGAVLLFC